MKTGIEQVARSIFGAGDSDSVDRWVKYWAGSRARNETLLKTFSAIVAVDFRGKNVLDIGCGTGGMGEVIGGECKLYVGADYNLHVLRFAESAEGREYLQCSGIDLPFRSESFDYIFAFDVLEHVHQGRSQQIRFLKEMRRVLRPSGMIFLTTPNSWYPYEGHSRLYFPLYMPTFLANLYARWLNPGFLKEHRSFSEIAPMPPGALARALRRSKLLFLHDLPCALDRLDFAKHFPVRGALAYLGMGWYPHAEFWGILVRQDKRAFLRHKLRRHWFYEQNQPSFDASDFGPCLDFNIDGFGFQLLSGWYWHEQEEQGFRWIGKEATCYLQSRKPVRHVFVKGYSPKQNRFEVWVGVEPRRRVRIGEYLAAENSTFDLEFLIPYSGTAGAFIEVRLACERTFRPEDRDDKRELGAMIFQVGLS
jgi:2-polyprenyl-3-methyl-5-hydroxy-6-metoxy-1,4-benzoquinol methylase